MKASHVRVVATVEPFRRSEPPETVVVIAVTNHGTTPLDLIGVRWQCTDPRTLRHVSKKLHPSACVTRGIDLLPAKEVPIGRGETGLFVVPLASAEEFCDAICSLPDEAQWISVTHENSEVAHVEGRVLKASLLRLQTGAR